MSSPSRLQAALPAVLTFIFGLTFGLVAGRILWASGVPSGQQAARGGGGMATGGQGAAQGGGMQEPHDHEHEGEGGTDEGEMRKMLAAHEQLLKEKPGDVDLVRTVGNYHSLLGENDKALEYYATARDLAVKAGDQSKVIDIMVDQGVAHVEKGDIPAGLKVLEEASAMDSKDVRSRLTRVAVYMERAIASPPPGWDRKQIVASAESVLTEVEALEPTNAYAIQFRQTLDGVRQMMGRPRPGTEGAPAAASAP